jgi:NAD(P)H-hydrate epimerase
MIGRPLLTPDAARARDREAIALGVPGIVLMENAGRGATDVLLRELGAHLRAPLVIGGTGQNGGDAWVVARHLAARGVRCRVLLVGDVAKIAGDAAIALRALEAVGIAPEHVTSLDRLAPLDAALASATVVVDGLFGTGLDRPLEGLARGVVERLAACGLPCLALDLPSGVCGRTGQILGAAVRADVTVTFDALKRGLHQFPGVTHAGRVVVVDIGIPGPRTADAWVVDRETLAAVRRRRPQDAHKGTAGRVLVVGGSPGRTGAALLAGLGALRAGAGLVTLAARGAARTALDAKVTELMTREVPEALEAGVAAVLADAAQVDAAVLGPGLGADDAARRFVRRIAQELPVPAVLDADALNAFASDDGAAVASLARAAAPRILTPHPAEAARLLGVDVPTVQRDRYDAARRLAVASGQVVVLKGARTVIAGEQLVVCAAGTPALGVAGTGDVLAGVIGAQLVEASRHGDAPFWAAWTGALAHALAGERAAGGRDRGLLAQEVAEAVSFVLGACAAEK